MATYEINIPNEGTFQIESDVELTNDEAIQAVYDQMKSQEPKTVGGFTKNVGRDIKDIGVGALTAIANPLETTGGIADIATTGAVNLLPKPLVDALFAYEKDPTSIQYKLNQYFKESPYLDFLYTAPREQYEKMGTEIGKELKELTTAEGITSRLYEKPVTSLLDLSFGGRAITTPIKGTKYGGMLNKGFEVIDPTQLVTKPIEKYVSKPLEERAAKTKSQYAVSDADAQMFSDYGYKFTPSQVRTSGAVSSTAEKFVGDKMPLKVVQENQQVTNKLIRKHLDIPEDTPLDPDTILDIVRQRSSSKYQNVKNLKKHKIVEPDTVTYDKFGMPQTKKGKVTFTKSGAELLQDLEKQRKITQQTFKDAKNPSPNAKKKVTYDDAYAEVEKQKGIENQIEELARLKGETGILDDLAEARKDYARAYSIQDSIVKGDLDAVKFSKRNKNAPLDREGKVIADFADQYQDIAKLSSSVKAQAGKGGWTQMIKNYAPAGLGFGIGAFDPTLAAIYFGGRGTIPSLLMSKPAQRIMLNPNNLGLAQGLSRFGASTGAVGSAAYIPSLLQSSDIEDLPYL